MEEWKFKSQRGVSLIETIIMAGILVLTIQFIAQLMANFRTFERHKRLKLSSLHIKSQINKRLSTLDCSAIANSIASPCSDGDDIRIFYLAPDETTEIDLIKIPSDPEDFEEYSRIGNHLLRAKCRICPAQTGPYPPICTTGDPIISIEALFVALDRSDPYDVKVKGKLKYYLGKKKKIGPPSTLENDIEWFPMYDPKKVPFKCGLQ